jgi:hypothetical protein
MLFPTANVGRLSSSMKNRVDNLALFEVDGRGEHRYAHDQSYSAVGEWDLPHYRSCHSRPVIMSAPVMLRLLPHLPFRS